MNKLKLTKSNNRKSQLFLAGLIAYFSLISSSVKAQIVPDNTLGADRSLVIPNVQINGITSDRIEGGAVRGSNLFHSFEDFNINEGRGAYFANPASIINIFTRVTGVNPSSILGTLGVLGNANLYLINPNGIFFGPDARLDLRGSLFVTTASALIFPDGSEYSARNPVAPPLLTVNVPQPVGLRFQGQEGMITNAADLKVASRQTLSLSGADVRMTGNMTASGGRIELIGSQSVALLNNAKIDVSADDGGGSVFIGSDGVISGKRTYIGNNVSINLNAIVNGNGGRAVVSADEVTAFYGTITATGGAESGDGGRMEISGKQHLIFRGNLNTAIVNGLSGTLSLNSANILIASGSDNSGGGGSTSGPNNAQIGTILNSPVSEVINIFPATVYESALERLPGDTNIVLGAGNNITLENLRDNRLNLASGKGIITIRADVDKDGAGNFVMADREDTIFANGRNTQVSGVDLFIGSLNTSRDVPTSRPPRDSGSLTLNATGDINIQGSVDTSAFFGSGGGIEVQARSIFLGDGGRITASVLAGPGNGGNININARESIELSGRNRRDRASAILTGGSFSGTGNSGDITINTGFLTLKDGASISNSVFMLESGAMQQVGRAGTISINARDGITLEAPEATRQELFTRITSEGPIMAQGMPGEIKINTPSLNLKDGSTISTLTYSDGDGGTISIHTGSLSLTGRASIVSTTSWKGNAGLIVINAQDNISLQGQDNNRVGIFSETAFGAEGLAGEITINTNSLSVLDGARISTATDGLGDAGVINIVSSDKITLAGKNSEGVGSSILSAVNSRATGNSQGIKITAGTLSVSDGAFISAETAGKGNAGNILIRANRLDMSDGGRLRVNTTTDFNAGDITLNISDRLSLSGTDTGLFAQTQGAGKAGNITINSPEVILDSSASISAFTEGSGNSGTITVNAPRAVLLSDSSQLTVATSGGGKPGDINITTAELTIGKDAQISATSTVTSTNTETGGSISINASRLNLTGKLGIFAETQGVAPAGTLNLQPDNDKPNLDIDFTDTAIISASTTSSGRGGDINISAPETINIRGEGKITVDTTGAGNAGNINLTGKTLNLRDSTITASTSGGNGGSINISGDNLNLAQGSQIRTTTSGNSNAGDISLRIKDSFSASGNNTGIFADTVVNALGNGGNIFINSGLLLLSENAIVSVDNLGIGVGGNINIYTNNLALNNAKITGQTASNTGGNITMFINNILALRNGSNISTTAGTAGAGGDGGNIKIDSRFILAIPSENSDISANAFLGNGGNIFINTEGILGINFREAETILSDITASSEFGLAGIVAINNPNTDPNQGLVSLPQQSVDIKIVSGCDFNRGAASAFYNLGRGGIADNPGGLFSGDIGEDWLPLNSVSEGGGFIYEPKNLRLGAKCWDLEPQRHKEHRGG